MRAVALVLIFVAVASAIHINSKAEISASEKGVSCHTFTTCLTCVAGLGKSFWSGDYGCTWAQGVGCRKRKSDRLPSDGGWVRAKAKCPAPDAPASIVVPIPAYKQRVFAPSVALGYCGHLPSKACRINPFGLKDFDKAQAIVPLFKKVAVTDVGFAGPNGRMTVANKATKAVNIDPSKSIYDVGVEAGKRACGSGQPAARAVGLAQALTTPDARRAGIEAAADTVASTILDPTCMAAVCDTLALAVISKMRAAGATARLEWVTYRYSDKAGHSVVVVNRPPGSDINNWKTWGDDYYVIDLWYMGLLQDPSLDANGAPASGIRWGTEAKAHSSSEQRSATRTRTVRTEDPPGTFTESEVQVGRGVEAQYDSTWAGSVVDRGPAIKAPVVVVAQVATFAVYDKSGKHILGEFTADEIAANLANLVKKEESGKVFYLHQQVTEDMAE